MKQQLSAWMSLVMLALWGCGGTTPGSEAGEALGQEESALVSCSTSCPSGSNLSCWGSTCSAVDGSYVQCDGAYQYCQVTPPLDCSNPSQSCVNVLGTSCSPYGSQRKCCLDGLPTGSCTCTTQYGWMCTVPPQDP
ncbi:hypothetical protein LZ198_40795 [Myxococcus sp. K15C18031901]|uniref:hypothetical protein n=1 Tax=Myxococcus dinghuensis TaxID=2906761 RepID=UPI0020A7B36D|nr:hypothetical protein [Myxococcus dinghuensis]MCP3105227.1 hypothetical protein [Myxococcus dinghuensis]